MSHDGTAIAKAGFQGVVGTRTQVSRRMRGYDALVEAGLFSLWGNSRCTTWPLRCDVSAHPVPLASTILTTSPSYVSYMPTRHSHGNHLLERPRRIRI